MTLQEFFAQHPRLALGLSGGVDSAYLLAEAVRCGCQIQPYFVDSPFQPRFELEHAQRLCAEQGVTLKVLPAQPLADPQVARNDSQRCYYCKKQVFGAILAAAKADGYTVIIDGTNASDDASDRPGMRALAEMQVYSPLRLCGITKAQVRQRSKELGVFTWNKPAYACLATRIPTGTAITEEALQRVEQAENEMFRLGFTDFRVRLWGQTARLQLPESQLEQAAKRHGEIVTALSPWFEGVVLDLVPREES